MKNYKKLSLGLLSLCTLASCKKAGGLGIDGYLEEISKTDDQAVYDNALKTFSTLLTDAGNERSSVDLRYVKYAKAEAELLDSAIFLPTTSHGGAYTISHVAPHTVPFVSAGNDDYRLKGQVITNELIKKEDIAALRQLWETARSKGEKYDPKTYLTEKSYTFKDTLTTTWTTAPVTFDAQASSAQGDSEIYVNTYDDLVEYDNEGNLKGAIAEDDYDGKGHPYKVSEDGKTYTFKIRSSVKWVNKDGQEYTDVTAQDFVTGFQHLLDAGAGGQDLVDGIIVGVKEYLHDGGSFDNVGFKAEGDILTIKLVNAESYFPSRLAYTIFAPLNKEFFESKGGKLGISELKAAMGEKSYTYGKTLEDVLSCGPYMITKNTAEKTSGDIGLTANPLYYKKDSVNLKSITFTYDSGENVEQLYKNVIDGTYAGSALTNAMIKKAKDDGNFEKYAYVSETDSTTFFGSLNLKRQTFALANGGAKSPKTGDEAKAFYDAVQNKSFRKAVLYAFNRTKYNAARRGEELAEKSLRNMYTQPDMVTLSTSVTFDGHTFDKGSTYGDVCQYYVDKVGDGIKVSKDQTDGWNLPDKAKEYIAKAKTELGDKWKGPVKLDLVVMSDVTWQVNQANTVKQNLEGTLGTDNIIVNVVMAAKDDYYAVGYRANSGKELGMDLFDGSGWGPDFLDPSSYLDTFKPDGAGYMTRVIGLW